MKERTNLFDMINEICDENDSLHKENKCLKEEIANRENVRIDIDSYVRKLLVERYRLRKEIDDKDEIILSLRDDFKEVINDNIALTKENKRLLEEMKLMVKDHEEECADYITMLKEKVDINDLHFIFSEYLDGKCKPSSVTIILFQIMDKIKEYIDKNKE